MKKLFLVLGIVLLFGACGELKSYTVLITNDSSRIVSYTYNDTSDSLAPSTSKTYYEVKAYTQPPVIVEPDQSKGKSVLIKYDTSTGGYSFVDPEL